MARIAGVNIPTNKRVVIALQYIHGIGKKFAQEIVDKVGIPLDRRVNQLTDAKFWRSVKPSTATIVSKATCVAKYR